MCEHGKHELDLWRNSMGRREVGTGRARTERNGEDDSEM